jgi:hypothetical protein
LRIFQTPINQNNKYRNVQKAHQYFYSIMPTQTP